MEFNSSYFHTFGNPDFAAVFSGDGDSVQALRLCPSAGDGADVKAEKGADRHTIPSTVFYVPEEEPEEAHHFLDQCSRCRKFLTGDIFMYRGDTPFCSEQCRRKQIEMEKAKHRRKKQNSPKAQAQGVAAEHRETAPQLRKLQPQ